MIQRNSIIIHHHQKQNDNMDGQMDQAGLKSRNSGEILQMYFTYVQVANRMF